MGVLLYLHTNLETNLNLERADILATSYLIKSLFDGLVLEIQLKCFKVVVRFGNSDVMVKHYVMHYHIFLSSGF